MESISDCFSRLSVAETLVPNKRTGVVYDDRMTEHSCLFDPNHIEQPKRYICPLQRCRDYGLLDRCVSITPKCAEESDILMLHDKEYLETVKKSKDYVDVDELEKLSSNFDSVYFHPKTYDAALLAAGCTLQLVRAVLENEVQNGMAIVRPPGHHAMEKEACGFCFFNNVALGAMLALEHYKLSKIMIVDWDVHHGQATQQMFYNDPRVLYISIHRYEHGAFWPELRESNFDFAGEENGKGFNINIPLNETKAGNGDYLAIFNNIILPVAYEFNPELVIVSAGYDAALGCPEGEMEVTPQAYAHLTHLLSGLANGRLCVVLEGGYCLPSLSESVALTLRSLLGDPCPAIHPTTGIQESVIESILNVICVHRNYWESLNLQDVYDSEDAELDSQKKKHSYEVKYVGTLPLSRPTNYPTRDYYPVLDKSISLNLETRLEKLIGETDLTVPDRSTCIGFDMGMTEHVNQREKWHPEKPERITAIYEKLRTDLLIKCHVLLPRRATEKELGLVHVQDYIEEIKSTRLMKNRDIAKLQAEYQSVYMCQGTYEAATLACGSLLEVVDSVCKRECQNGFAIIRPPGHHAGVDEACGFCIFNSVAVAARYAVENHCVKKILILDWDVHHGNGTQNIFYSDSQVLYVSLHRHDCATFFPCLQEADYDAVGEGPGMGYNINIPWNGPVGDGDFLAAFFHVILPVAYEFSPDLVLVSAGFDAAKDDPLGGCKVSPACFGHLTHLLKGLANGRIILALEGGYNIMSTSQAVFQCVSALLGEPCDNMKEPKVPSNSAIESIKNVIGQHKKYWKCLQFAACLPPVRTPTPPKELPDSAQAVKPSSPVSIPRKDSVSECKPFEFERMESTSCDAVSCEVMDGAIGGIENDRRLLYCVSPLEYCPHLELIQSLPAEGLDPRASCQDCGDPSENWVCLHCYQVYCGRFINEHMLSHGINMQHYLTLSYSDLSVWCYACDSYVHNPVLMPAKQHVHVMKFGLPM